MTTVYVPSRNWDSPTPATASECAPLPPPEPLACGWGAGGIPIPTRGQTLWYSIFIIGEKAEHAAYSVVTTIGGEKKFYLDLQKYDTE